MTPEDRTAHEEWLQREAARCGETLRDKSRRYLEMNYTYKTTPGYIPNRDGYCPKRREWTEVTDEEILVALRAMGWNRLEDQFARAWASWVFSEILKDNQREPLRFTMSTVDADPDLTIQREWPEEYRHLLLPTAPTIAAEWDAWLWWQAHQFTGGGLRARGGMGAPWLFQDPKKLYSIFRESGRCPLEDAFHYSWNKWWEGPRYGMQPAGLWIFDDKRCWYENDEERRIKLVSELEVPVEVTT